MWNTVPKIATPIALAAFALGVALTIVRSYLKRRADLIKLARPEDRGRLIDEATSDYGIRAENLTREQRYQLVVKGLEGRAFRFRVSAVVLIILALLMTIILLVAILAKPSTEHQATLTSNGNGNNPTVDLPSIPAAAVVRTAFEMNPPARPANVPEPEIDFHVLARHAGQEEFHDLMANDLVASGVDPYVFYAKAGTAGYLYIFQVDSSGRCEWFFPKNATSSHSSGTNPLSAGEVVVLPPRESSSAFFLDDVTGEEHVFVVFSATQWPYLEKALANPAASNGLTKLSSTASSEPSLELSKSWTVKLRGAAKGTMQLDSPVQIDVGAKTYKLSVKGISMRGANGAVAVDKVFKHVAAP